MRSAGDEDEKGLSFRQLVAAFLAVVALCAVFFSLGFFVGYKERTSPPAPATENVPLPADVPPVVNPPAEDAEAAPASMPGAPATSASAPPATPAESSQSTAVTESSVPNPSTAQTATAPPGPSVGASKPSPPASSENAEAAGAAAPVPSTAIKGITVQVAALSNRQDADSLINVLKGRGYAALLMSPEQAHADDDLFRVVVGPFQSAAEAEKVRTKLALAGFRPFVRK